MNPFKIPRTFSFFPALLKSMHVLFPWTLKSLQLWGHEGLSSESRCSVQTSGTYQCLRNRFSRSSWSCWSERTGRRSLWAAGGRWSCLDSPPHSTQNRTGRRIAGRWANLQNSNQNQVTETRVNPTDSVRFRYFYGCLYFHSLISYFRWWFIYFSLFLNIQPNLLHLKTLTSYYMADCSCCHLKLHQTQQNLLGFT